VALRGFLNYLSRESLTPNTPDWPGWLWALFVASGGVGMTIIHHQVGGRWHMAAAVGCSCATPWLGALPELLTGCSKRPWQLSMHVSCPTVLLQWSRVYLTLTNPRLLCFP
jgi:hypothetical protein